MSNKQYLAYTTLGIIAVSWLFELEWDRTSAGYKYFAYCAIAAIPTLTWVLKSVKEDDVPVDTAVAGFLVGTMITVFCAKVAFWFVICPLVAAFDGTPCYEGCDDGY